MKTLPLSLPLRFLIGILLVLALSLLIFNLIMHPPLGDLNLMALFLGITAAISGLAGYIAYRLGWLNRMPSLQLSLLGGYALASLLTFFNVWVTARLMFASQHDLLLATILLVFAAGIAMLLGYFLSSGITRRIDALKNAAHLLSRGDLSARAPYEGRDEIADLAASFNHMADQLQQVDTRQRQLDMLRRELVAWTTHDLQTPLTAIRVQIEALADGLVEDPATRERYLRTTQRQIKDLSLMIDDLFQIAQFDAGGLTIQPVVCSLADLISDTLESFTALAHERGIVLSGSAAPDVDPVTLDSPRIGRLLNNLMGNALRHTSLGGAVTVSAWREATQVHITVSDTGEGISPEDLPHVFDRFYRGEKSRNRGTGGSGLGLAVARAIAQAHNGHITVESQLGVGSIFHAVFPA